MRALAALALLASVAVAQEPAAPAAPVAPEVPQLVTPSPLPGEALPSGATWTTTASGLRYVVFAPGDETKAGPGPTDKVTVYYAGFLEDGTKVDACLAPQQPYSLMLNKVMKGWTEGLKLMHPGAKFKFHIPYQLAYGTRGSPPRVPAKANLVFDVELLTVTPDPSPKFSLPSDAELTTTPSGLKFQLIKPGKPDGKKPGASERVTINYAGWLTDGTPFDSSYAKGQPLTYQVNQFVKGFGEGLQMMQEGAICKFVIPGPLGYGAAGGAGGRIPPNATLVFYVEMIKIGA